MPRVNPKETSGTPSNGSQPASRRSISRFLGEAVDEAAGVVEDLLDRLPGGRTERLVKRYANRKLYDTALGAFTTLAALEILVREGIDVKVIDHDSGADLTQETLGQIVDRVARTDRGIWSGSIELYPIPRGGRPGVGE